jgi:sphingolipid delta-4 desaturase
MFIQIFFYALRPVMVKPDVAEMVQTKKFTDLATNWIIQLSFDALMVYWLGWNAMLYFLISTFFAGSIHPIAGHFIAEHYVFEGSHETYSYYGPLNYLCYNVGYHNEHHDFPNIPWSGLPKLREIAKEFYDPLPQCTSWFGVVIRYIFDDSITPYSRVKRGEVPVHISKATN